MRTIIMKMWLVVAAALTVTLTSCSNDDDDNNTGNSGKLTYMANIQVSDDLLSLATLNIQEYGNNGLGSATALTKTTYDWTKQIASYPAKVGLAFSIEPKDGELIKEKYDIAITYKASIVDEKGNVKGVAVSYTKMLNGIKAANVPAQLERIQSDLLRQNTIFDFTSPASFTQTSASDVE